MNKNDIDEIKDKVTKYAAEIDLDDEILQRLYIRLAENICADLNTLWFYHNALAERSTK